MFVWNSIIVVHDSVLSISNLLKLYRSSPASRVQWFGRASSIYCQIAVEHFAYSEEGDITQNVSSF